MLEKLTFKELVKIMNKQELEDGVVRYTYLQDNLHKVNVIDDVIFQDIFIRFYVVKTTKFEGLKESMFRILEENKNNKDIKFEDVLKELYNDTGFILSSYASKIVATINPDKAVLDSVLRGHFNLRLLSGVANTRATIDQYYELNKLMNNLLLDDRCDEVIDVFDCYFRGNKLTNMKKLDLILWQWR